MDTGGEKCEWDAWTINAVAKQGNLEMLKYCVAHEFPAEEEGLCAFAALGGSLECLK